MATPKIKLCFANPIIMWKNQFVDGYLVGEYTYLYICIFWCVRERASGVGMNIFIVVN